MLTFGFTQGRERWFAWVKVLCLFDPSISPSFYPASTFSLSYYITGNFFRSGVWMHLLSTELNGKDWHIICTEVGISTARDFGHWAVQFHFLSPLRPIALCVRFPRQSFKQSPHISALWYHN